MCDSCCASAPGPSTVVKRWQALSRISSRNSFGTEMSVSPIERPSANINERTSTALPLPCSLSFAPATRLRPRHSKSSKVSTVRSGAPSLSTRGAASSRSQAATDSANSQRSTGVGLISMRVPSARNTAASRSMSLPPQASGPIRRGNGSAIAIARMRLSHSVGSLVTPAESKLGPAASRKDCGSIQIGGRGRGKGTSSATAMPPPAPASHRSANKSRIRWMSAAIEAFLRDQGATGNASRPYLSHETVAPPIPVANLRPGWRGAPAQKTNNQEGNAMHGLMQNWPLLCHRIIDHAATFHGERKVISRSVEGPIHTTTSAEVRARALKVAQRLEKDGFKLGDRVATLAWNTWRHLETWYGILGIGAIYHTVNPRLFPEQIAWIINHAGDRVMMTDLTFVPLLEKIADKLPSIEHYVVLTDAAHMPNTTLKNAVAYEDWIGEVDGNFTWKSFDENTAAGMCYTSGTTGHPKGVLYSHRSNVLHAFMASMPDCKGLASRDVVLPVVPLFHANGWSLAFSTPMVGASLVMPGPKLDGASIYELLNTYKVTFTAAVPTVWLMLLQDLEKTGGKLPHLKKVVIGGSACPRAMTKTFQDVYGVEVCHAWGMTEMSPLGTRGSLKPEYARLGGEERLDIQMKQGHAPFGVEIKIADDADKELPRDSKTFGRLKV